MKNVNIHDLISFIDLSELMTLCFILSFLFLLSSQALDHLGLTRYCCRRMLLTHADLIEKLLAYNSKPNACSLFSAAFVDTTQRLLLDCTTLLSLELSSISSIRLVGVAFIILAEKRKMQLLNLVKRFR